jgi:hypothetical protein
MSLLDCYWEWQEEESDGAKPSMEQKSEDQETLWYYGWVFVEEDQDL